LAAVAAACSNSPTTPSTASLAGAWRATRAEFISQVNSNVRVEAVSQGVVLVLALDSAGTCTLTVTEPGRASEVSGGNWRASGDVLTLTWTSGQHGDTQFDMALSGNTLTLNGGHMLYDVDGNDLDEETVLNLTLTRQ
jgi:hypothetical protein